MDMLESVLQKLPRLWAFYLKWNFCKAHLADGSRKPDTIFSRIFERVFYLECSCCSALRGIVFGFVLGVLAHKLWRWLLCLI